MVGRQRLMSGSEVEDSSSPAGIAAAVAKYLAASKPTQKNQGLWLRYIEKFAIHLFTLDVEVLAYAYGNGMSWGGYPQAFTIIRFAPFQAATAAHETFKDLGLVA